MKKLKFSFINLGCNKNLVDTQFLLGNIFSLAWNNPNYEIDYINDPYDDEVEYVFLNTCGFISSGRYEMFEEIDKLLDAGKKIYLLGCALQYFESTLSGDSWNNMSFETEGEKSTSRNNRFRFSGYKYKACRDCALSYHI